MYVLVAASMPSIFHNIVGYKAGEKRFSIRCHNTFYILLPTFLLIKIWHSQMYCIGNNNFNLCFFLLPSLLLSNSPKLLVKFFVPTPKIWDTLCSKHRIPYVLWFKMNYPSVVCYILVFYDRSELLFKTPLLSFHSFILLFKIR